MTWTEILRQVLIAAGFCLSHGSSLNEALSKEVNLMSKYGLRPGTLQGELFNDLLLQGNNGSKVSELAKSMSIVELNLAATTNELELLISSVLSSDVTLFEKIASSAYRVRINSVLHESESDQSDVDDVGRDGCRYISSYDSEFDSRISSPSNLKPRNS
ncbi:hypothetical protein POM88_025982 [Heracleum sosnowskyi]|uniref:Uncharacterized protein n=1 Tax=Heracleum sosnowskyi TaxID=360622 RepID=A0AAD8I5L2_9APIA|nr:hypothetical protein POM88_025982 [Heracleum sosnowskyi]